MLICEREGEGQIGDMVGRWRKREKKGQRERKKEEELSLIGGELHDHKPWWS